MARLLRIMRVLTAMAVLAVALLICWQAIDIYTDGRAANLAAGADIFRADDIKARLKSLAGPLIVSGIVTVVTVVMHAMAPQKAIEGRFREARVYTSNKAAPLKGKCKLQLVILCAAVAFILLGIMNGSAFDVLVKAINICTECIGLG